MIHRTKNAVMIPAGRVAQLVKTMVGINCIAIMRVSPSLSWLAVADSGEVATAIPNWVRMVMATIGTTEKMPRSIVVTRPRPRTKQARTIHVMHEERSHSHGPIESPKCISFNAKPAVTAIAPAIATAAVKRASPPDIALTS